MHSLAVLRYLSLPLRVAPLVTILIFAVFLTVAEHMGVVGIPLLLAYGLWFFKYGFALLDHVIDGRSEPLLLSTEMANPFEGRPIGMVLFIGLFHYGTGLLEEYIGAGPVLALRLLLMALLPAMVTAMSVTGSFIVALNPIVVFGAIARIAADYAILLLVLGALWSIPAIAVYNDADSLSALWRAESFLPLGMLPAVGGRGLLLSLFVHVFVLYAWLAMFACIGGTIYERRKELDIEAAYAPERRAVRGNAELDRQRDVIFDRLFAQVRGGAIANAREHARKLIAESPQPLEECRWLLPRATALEDQRLANYVARVMLPWLLERKATREALEIVRGRLRVSSDFRPATGAETLQLAELAPAAGDRGTAKRLLENFDQHFPNDPLAARASQFQADL